ncbi:glycosyltransferase family 2 protein [Victivallis sp. Marseille-Q1083]|uniref:glycosyltransferase family 2 protein n=1 Tax=Victivallis sp. Marseille-Q1083 TaxID=2717288 RepID=UPI00158E7B2A|nr:glycosyltransferase [Victivallis sp. Marseille-Q1083]
MKELIKITVILRVGGETRLLDRVLAALYAELPAGCEVMTVDCEPGSRNLAILADYPDIHHLPVKQSEYVPGRVMNRAAAAAAGEILVFQNDDAVAAPGWLGALIAPLAAPGVGAVYARQTPRADAWLPVVVDYRGVFGDGPGADDFFSIVSAAARRETLLACPFREDLRYAEDTEWALRLRAAGRRVVYVPGAVVEHSHNYPFRAFCRRCFREELAHVEIGRHTSICRHLFWRLPGGCCHDLQLAWRTGRCRELPRALVYRVLQHCSGAAGIVAGRWRKFLRRETA